MILKKLEYVVIIITYIVFFASIALLIRALAAQPVSGEAYKGDFGVSSYNEDWQLYIDGEDMGIVSLPFEVRDSENSQVVIQNSLPFDIVDGERLSFRTKTAYVEVYINGELRGTYGGGSISDYTKYPPSAYMFVDLFDEDAGGTVSIRVTSKEDARLHEISIGHGNNAWFPILSTNSLQLVIAIIMTLLGLFTLAASVILRFKLKTNKSILILGQTITMFGIWILNESQLRQLFLGSTVVSAILSYITLEVIIVLVIRYFDEIQGRKYHKIYFPLELIATAQLVINALLSVTRVVDAHDSLRLSHITMIVCMLAGVILVLYDVIRKQIKNYRIAALGMLFFLISGILEIALYYLIPFYTLGISMCFGLVLMLVATFIQVFATTISREVARREAVQEESLRTIEAIAGTLDAKDEYTGGHSERVAYYAQLLAEAVRDEFGFSDEDITWVKYNGLLHDIGKIGVPDKILNKVGKLTDEEYLLMKQHPSIGDSLLRGTHFLSRFSDGTRFHHERYDGRGYPDGLSGEDIPLIARILCLADSYDAMTSNRIYRKRLSDEDVIAEIKRCSGSQFDPQLAEVFCSLIENGTIRPQTERGLEIDFEGNTRKYSLLRNTLADDITGGRRTIINPSYVMMVADIIKLAESSGYSLDVFLIGVKTPDNEALVGDELINAKGILYEKLKSVSGQGDVWVEYSFLKYIVIWFGLSGEEKNDRQNEVRSAAEDWFKITIEEIG